MATVTVETLKTAQAELTEKLEKARKAKKATKTLREQLADVERQLTEVTSEKRGRGRPRAYPAAYYELRDALKRDGRGRPSRQETVDTLRYLGVEVDETLPTRRLEVQLVAEKAIALYAAKRA